MAQTSVCKKDDPGHTAVTTTDSTQQIPRSKKAPPPPEPFGFAKRIGFLLAFVKHFNVEKLARAFQWSPGMLLVGF